MDFRAHRALHFRWGPAVSREDPSSPDLCRGFSGLADKAVVVIVGMSDLVQVFIATAVVRVQAIVVQDQLAVLVRHVGESIRDSVT